VTQRDSSDAKNTATGAAEIAEVSRIFHALADNFTEMTVFLLSNHEEAERRLDALERRMPRPPRVRGKPALRLVNRGKQ
jgi:hypothetical protein